MRDYSIETVRKVYDDTEGVCVEVGSCRDGNTGVVSIYTEDKKSVEWYGLVYLSLSPAQARLLATAILARADEAEAEVA